MIVATDTLEEIQSLYDQGLFGQAYDMVVSRQLPIPSRWRGIEGRILAGRLTTSVGDARLGDAIRLCLLREFPDHPRAVYYGCGALLGIAGPLAVWERLKAFDKPVENPEDRADLLSLRAFVAAMFRDGSTALSLIGQALESVPAEAFTHVQHSAILERLDRREEALEAVERGWAIRPWYTPLISQKAMLLHSARRDQEQEQLLLEALDRLEFGSFASMLGDLYIEQERFEDARAAYERALSIWRLKPPKLMDAMSARISDSCYRCGDLDSALEHARKVEGKFFKRLVERMSRKSEAPGRRVLAVDFVQQHFSTCAPATMTSIARFFDQPVEHLEVVEEICFGGTSQTHQRKWAEDRGWVVREFTLGWAAAVALLDRGVPFAMSTEEALTGHLQAVIGYDDLRRTYLLRDPMHRGMPECAADEFADHYKDVGPRCMAMVPGDRASLLEGLELPDEALYELRYRLERALIDHDRPRASTYADEAERIAPDHRIALECRLAIACYDGNLEAERQVTGQLAAMFDHRPVWLLRHANCLDRLGLVNQQMDLLRPHALKPDADAFVRMRFGKLLADDGQTSVQGERMLRRTLTRMLDQPALLHSLARMRTTAGDRVFGLELHRFAACLSERDEYFAQSYFATCHGMHRPREGLVLLARRYLLYGRKGVGPIITLFNALMDIDDSATAFALLERAIRQRGDDGDTLLFAAETMGRWNRVDRARQLLEKARGKSHQGHWLLNAGRIARYDGDFAAALKSYRELVELDPFSVEAHAQITQMLDALEGRDKAIEYLQQAAGRFPHYIPLQTLRIEWLRDEDIEASIKALKELLEIEPGNAWALRELAFQLIGERRIEEAQPVVDRAVAAEPRSEGTFNLRVTLLAANDQDEEARAIARKGLEFSIRNEWLIERLCGLAPDGGSRLEELRFIWRVFQEQTPPDGTLLCIWTQSSDTMNPRELRERVQSHRRAHPEHWAAWLAEIQQLRQEQELDDALKLSAMACQRFSLVPAIWVERSRICRAMLDDEGEIEALSQAIAVNPSWGMPRRLLIEVHERRGDLSRCLELAEQAVARAPFEAASHGFMAEALWRMDRHDEAIERLERAVALEPGYEWAWEKLDQWGRERGQTDVALQRATTLAQRRPGEPRNWLILARLRQVEGQFDQSLEAVERALALNPKLVDAHEHRAVVLMQALRFDEAIKACRPSCFGKKRPVILIGREAYIQVERRNMSAGLELMKQAVSIEPAYYWGWSMLTHWYLWLGRNDQAVEAARMLVRLRPTDPESMMQLAKTQQQAGDRKAARETLERCVRTSPGYMPAVQELVSMLWDAGEHTALDALLEQIGPFVSRAYLLTWRCAVAAALKRDDQLGEWLSQAVGQRDVTMDDLLFIADPIQKPGVSKTIHDVIAGRMTDSEVSPGALGWIAYYLSKRRRRAKALKMFQQRTEHDDHWHGMAVGLVRAADGKTMRKLILRYGKSLSSRTSTWGWVSYGLMLNGLVRLCHHFCSGLKQREDVEQWMLSNVAEAERTLRLYEQAAETSRRALGLRADHSFDQHLVWLIAEAIRTGDWNSLVSLQSELQLNHVPDNAWVCGHLVESVCRYLNEVSSAGEDEELVKRAEKRLRADLRLAVTHGHWHQNEKRFGRLYCAMIARITTLFRSRWARWSWRLRMAMQANGLWMRLR
ncbi:MAG: tetratricopeptide repeat protein [Phycisphaeraceae bacterium]|nr:tetratricopeptide repeat protein [Phycisphaeraceae bacterium]